MPGPEAALQAPTLILPGRTPPGKYFVFFSSIRTQRNKHLNCVRLVLVCTASTASAGRRFQRALSIGLRSSDRSYLRWRDLACRATSKNASRSPTFASLGSERMITVIAKRTGLIRVEPMSPTRSRSLCRSGNPVCAAGLSTCGGGQRRSSEHGRRDRY